MGRARIAGVLVAVVASLAFATAAGARAAGPTLSVDAAAGRHPINPLIYGLNFAPANLAQELHLPVDRWGGNLTDTYNYKLAAANTGNDWYYENVADCWDAIDNWCANGKVYGYQRQIAQDRSTGTRTLLTLPLMGRVANDANVAHPLTCGFPASIFSSQDSFDPYDTNCGNGMHSGNPLASTPDRTGIAIDASWNADWIAQLKTLYGAADQGGVGLYEMGNEPGLWSSSHRDMHPQRETYDELLNKSKALAIAVKQADPKAQTLGYSEWGWPNYFCSDADNVQNGCSAQSPDRKAHGGMALAPWYLQKMRDASRAQGRRLLDYFDLHYYRQGGSTTDVTRSLWDPTYTDPSWINDKIDLIPRMRDWVAANYPKTKLSLSEYNLSVGDPRTNVLIEADTLGIFAREGLDLATFWPLGNDGSQIYDAFRMFRNYDGRGGKFFDQYVSSTSSDQSKLAVYASRRTQTGRLTVLVINKTSQDLTSPLNLANASPPSSAGAWQWAGSGIQHLAAQPIAGHTLTATYPARSLTLFVI